MAEDQINTWKRITTDDTRRPGCLGPSPGCTKPSNFLNPFSSTRVSVCNGGYRFEAIYVVGELFFPSGEKRNNSNEGCKYACVLVCQRTRVWKGEWGKGSGLGGGVNGTREEKRRKSKARWVDVNLRIVSALVDKLRNGDGDGENKHVEGRAAIEGRHHGEHSAHDAVTHKSTLK